MILDNIPEKYPNKPSLEEIYKLRDNLSSILLGKKKILKIFLNK